MSLDLEILKIKLTNRLDGETKESFESWLKERRACSLYKHKKSTATHYIGKSGKEYALQEWCNWGGGETKHGKKDLPGEDYPYGLKYRVEPMFKCCTLCDCFSDKNC